MAHIKICKMRDCKNAATTRGYCRLHYLRHWKDIREKEHQKAADKLNRYVEYMSKNYGEDYLDAIKEDLQSDNLDNRMSEVFENENLPFDEPTYEEEIEKLINELKVEKGF